jgi:hypothetical protein
MNRDEEVFVMENLIWLICQVHPKATAMHIQRNWTLHVVLREYEMPSYGTLQVWVKEAHAKA